MKRSCSNECEFLKHSSVLLAHFLRRGYPLELILDNGDRVRATMRDTCLQLKKETERGWRRHLDLDLCFNLHISFWLVHVSHCMNGDDNHSCFISSCTCGWTINLYNLTWLVIDGYVGSIRNVPVNNHPYKARVTNGLPYINPQQSKHNISLKKCKTQLEIWTQWNDTSTIIFLITEFSLHGSLFTEIKID